MVACFQWQDSMFEPHLINPIFSRSIITEPPALLGCWRRRGGTVLSWRLAIYYAPQPPPAASRAGLSVIAALSGNAPPTPPATGCSKLLFLWETIKEMLPSVQNLNCVMHGLCRGVVAAPPRGLASLLAPRDPGGATAASTPAHSLCTCNF